MSEAFDPYLKWLGIAPKDQPPNHYRLLGIDPFTDDPEVIESAADRQMKHVRSFQAGRHAQHSQRILNELAAAKVCLLNAERKLEYDESLRSEASARAAQGLAVAKPIAAAPISAPGQPAGAPLIDTSSAGESGTVTPARTRHRSRRRSALPVLPVVLSVLGVIVVVVVVVVAMSTRESGSELAGQSAHAGRVAQASDIKNSPQRPSKVASAGIPASDVQVPAPAAENEREPELPFANPHQSNSDPPVKPDQPPVISTETDLEPTAPTIPAEPAAQPAVSDATSADTRRAVPDEQHIEQALAAVRDAFGQQNEDAKTVEQKRELAQQIILAASETGDDSAAQFVLLRVGRDFAANSGDVATTMQAVDAASRQFQVDGQRLRFDALLRLATSIRDADQFKLLDQHAVAAINNFVDADQFASALQLADAVLTASRKTEDIELIKQAVASQRAVQSSADAYDEVAPAIAQLEIDPDNADANLKVGKYRCFERSDWIGGLRLLAKGSDERFRQLAEMELRTPSQAADVIQLADGWFEVAESAEDAERQSLLRRAAFWYARVSAAELPPIDRVKLQSREDELAKVLIPDSTPTADPPLATGPRPRDPTAAKPPPIPKLAKGRLLVMNSKNSAEIFVNDQRIGKAGYYSSQCLCSLKVGDVITARITPGPHSPSFAMIFQMPDGRVVIPTHRSTWFSYTPADPEKWWNAPADAEKRPVVVAKNQGVPGPAQPTACEAILGSYVQHTVTEKDFQRAVPPAFATADRPRGAIAATLYVMNRKNTADIFINGYFVCRAGYYGTERPIYLSAGDVIAAKLLSGHDPASFSCFIQLEGGKKSLPLNTKTWIHYDPADPLAWWDIEGHTNPHPPGRKGDQIPAAAAGTNCEAIWGGYVFYIVKESDLK